MDRKVVWTERNGTRWSYQLFNT